MITKKEDKSISHSGNKNRIWIEVFLLVIAIFFISLIFFFYYIFIQENLLTNKVYPNAFINNQDFGRQSKKDIINFFENKNQKLKKVQIAISLNGINEITFSGHKLGLRYDAEGLAERVFLIGRSTNFNSKIYQKLSTIFNLKSFQIKADITYDQEVLNDFIALTEEKYSLPAKDALFQFDNGRVVSFRKETNGQKIDAKKLQEEINKKINELKEKITDKNINLQLITIEPEITLNRVNNYGIEEFIGEGVSDFTHSIPERIHNIVLASSKLNGILIPKDSIFSFNDAVGDISSLTGYKPAYIIKGGKTVLGDGGGVCQVSTTLFRAALNTGLPIIERTAHAYRVAYYENDSKPGFDATVFAPSVDLKIHNNTPAYILIQTEIKEDKNLLTIKFFGKKDSRSVEISPITIVNEIPPPDPLYQDDPILKKGTIKQIDYPAWGAQTSFFYKVKLEDKTLFEKKFTSYYKPWRAIYLVGVAH